MRGWAFVELTRGQRAKVDVVDLPKLAGFSWYAMPNRNSGFAAIAHLHGTTFYMHRVLTDAPRGKQVDHINHDTLDNRRANLRLATCQQNSENRAGAYRTTSTGVRGVSIDRPTAYEDAERDGRHTNRSRPPGQTRTYYRGQVTLNYRVAASKRFPFTPEGLIQASEWVAAKRLALMPYATS